MSERVSTYTGMLESLYLHLHAVQVALATSINVIFIIVGESVDLSQYLDINILTGAVKLYLRELPIPLITFDAYKVLMKATSLVSDPDDPNEDWRPLIDALKLLPKAHYTTLKHLIQHLHKYV